jgi:hypothetical protein
MNSLSLNLKLVSPDEKISIEGIIFSGICYITISVDGKALLDNDLFYGSFVYWDELKKTKENSGKYLIFTSVSGIADDAGWDYVNVKHGASDIHWTFSINDQIITYKFDRDAYFKEITKLETKVENMNCNLKLEPLNVVFPE